MSDKNPVIRSGRRLPTGRAVLGGLLITLAVLAVLLATRLGEDATFQDVVVARRDLAPGTVLEADDLAEVRIRLDESVDFVATSSADVVGSVLLGPLSRLEFVQTSNLAPGPPGGVPAGLAEVSIPIEPQRAPERLSPGELVSVLATYDDDPTTTVLIADRVVVLSYRTDASEFAREGVLRLGIEDGRVAARIVNAVDDGQLHVIGITSAPEVDLPDEVTLASTREAAAE